MDALKIYRGAEVIAEVKCKKLDHFMQLMHEDYVQCNFESTVVTDIEVGDHIEIDGLKYKLNLPAVVKKKAENNYTYECKFEGDIYDLSKAVMLDIDNAGIHMGHEFFLTEQVGGFLQLIERNLERVFGSDQWILSHASGILNRPDVDLVFNRSGLSLAAGNTMIDGVLLTAGLRVLVLNSSNPDQVNKIFLLSGSGVGNWTWTVQQDGTGDDAPGYGNCVEVLQGDVYGSKKLGFAGYGWIEVVTGEELNPDLRYETIQFAEDSCLSALRKVCDMYDLEYEIEYISITDEKIIHLRKSVGAGMHVFEVGRENGLYEMTRGLVDSNNIITRLYCYGSSRNLGDNYRNFSPRLKFNSIGSYIEDQEKVDEYGIIEKVKIFDDVFPERAGTVSSVVSITEFTDESMFDLLAEDGEGNTLYWLPETLPKIHFNSGNLAGYEFEVISFDSETKKIKIRQVTDERSLVIPSADSSAFQFNVGDKYVLLDIRMPESYIDDAEERLYEKGLAFYNKHKQPRYRFDVTVDEKYAATMPGGDMKFFLGMGVGIIDNDLGFAYQSKIIRIERDRRHRQRYKLTFSDEGISYSSITRGRQGYIPSVGELGHKTTPVYDLSIYTDNETIEGSGAEGNKIRLKNLNDNKTYGVLNGAFHEITPDLHAVFNITHQTEETIAHNLGKKPAVAILNPEGDTCIADVMHIDNNNIKITFTDAFTGKVILN